MNSQLKKLVLVFITVLGVGSLFFAFSPKYSHAQLLPPEETSNPDTSNDDINFLPDSLQQNNNASNQNSQVGNLQITGSGYQKSESGLPICGILPGSNGTFEGCFVRFFYYVFLYPSAWLAGIAGQIFDYFIAFTLNSESYSSGGFVEQGWRVIRDLINASFIFILLYSAIVLIVKPDAPKVNRTITGVILAAIILNFSLFVTRAIIDAGNILGRVFYEKTIVQNDDLSQTTGYTTISAGLVGKVNPQKLLSPDIFRKRYTTSSVDNATQSNTLGGFSDTNVNNSSGLASEGFKVGSGFMILVILVATGINLMLVWIFVSVSIFLVGRTLGLWIMMITSPIAFASLGIPIFKKVPGYGFDSWIVQTSKLSFMAVVFMFFLYLTVMFIDISFETAFNIGGSAQNMSTIHLFMSVIIPIAAIWFLLKMAKDQAKSMAGSFGDMVGKALKYGTFATLGAAGLALGAAAGVGAVAGRQVIGRAGAKIAAGADTSTAWGRIKKSSGTYLANSKYDARNINIPKPAKSIIGFGKSGLSYATDGALKTGDFNLKGLNTFGKPSNKSYVQRREEYAQEKIGNAKMYKADEGSTVNNISGTYTYEEIDPQTGEVVKKTGRVSGETSVNGAKSDKAKAQRELEAKKAEIHDEQEYDEKKRELEVREKNAENAEKSYKEILDKKKAGDPSVRQRDVDIAEMERNSKKNLVNVQKKAIKNIENMYMQEANKVAEAEARIAAAERALAKKNAEILNNYADFVEKWAPISDATLTHRYGGSKDAVDEIRNLSNKEERKSEKK